MSRVFVRGLGAVSPGGWSVSQLRAALESRQPLPVQSLPRPGWDRSLPVRPVPPPPGRPAFLAHPRLRRASAITQYTIGAAQEALGDDLDRIRSGALRLGVIVCLMPGCIAYSRRFYEETLADPATASPLIFAETVFNAPASHLAAWLNSATASYTLVGDDGTFLQGLALAADWLERGRADGCVVVGAEETDWIAADAVRLFRRDRIYSGGAGALYLGTDPRSAVELAAITDSFSYTRAQGRIQAVRKMEAQLSGGMADDEGEGHRRTANSALFNEAFVAGAAWRCVEACDRIRQGELPAINIGIVGANQQAIGARFVRNLS